MLQLFMVTVCVIMLGNIHEKFFPIIICVTVAEKSFLHQPSLFSLGEQDKKNP